MVLDPRNAIANATALPFLFSVYVGDAQDYGYIMPLLSVDGNPISI